MLSLQHILMHGNFLSGTLPPEIDNLAKLVDHKLGRNPISGTVSLRPTAHIAHARPSSPLTAGGVCVAAPADDQAEAAAAEVQLQLLRTHRHLPRRLLAGQVPSAAAGLLGR